MAQARRWVSLTHGCVQCNHADVDEPVVHTGEHLCDLERALASGRLTSQLTELFTLSNRAPAEQDAMLEVPWLVSSRQINAVATTN